MNGHHVYPTNTSHRSQYAIIVVGFATDGTKIPNKLTYVFTDNCPSTIKAIPVVYLVYILLFCSWQAVINAENDVTLQFTTRRALHFLVKLRMNGVDDHYLDQFVKAETSGDDLIIKLLFPQPGQYGLDLYARPDSDSMDLTLAHACKYLINVIKVKKKIDLGAAKMENAAVLVNNKYGMMSACGKLGIKPLTHKDGKLKQMPAMFDIDFAVPAFVALSYHFIREPDEEYRDHITLLRENDGTTAKFKININKPGNYLLTIYGRKESDFEKMSNVYNYLITHDPDMTLSRKKKSK